MSAINISYADKGEGLNNSVFFQKNVNENNADPSKNKEINKNEHYSNKHDGFDKDCPLCECETCRNRRYKDKSDDGGVSFQQPTKLTPDQAAHRVKAHEMEHVRREQHKADREGKRVIAQSVQIMTDICPECGDKYVSGGLTRTSTKEVIPEFTELFFVGIERMFYGMKLDETA